MEGILFAEKQIGTMTILMHGIPLGDDLCLVLSGGDKPHVGATTLSQPRPSLLDSRERRATTSVLALVGHKEDELFRRIGERAAAEIGGSVVVCGGIHVDNASMDVVGDICAKAEEMLTELLSKFRDQVSLKFSAKESEEH